MDNHYYDRYWKRRLLKEKSDPIPLWLPHILIQYSAYGAILNRIPPGSKILDLGCGDGNVTRLYTVKGDVVGVDASEKALTQTKKRGIKAVQHDLNTLPYPFRQGSFDVVVLTDVLEHLIDPFATLRECKRILKKNGRVIITVPNFARLSNRIRMLFGDPVDILHFDKYGDEAEHLHWFTKPKLIHIAFTSGFTSISFVSTGLWSAGFVFGLIGVPQLGKFLTAVLTP